MQPVIITRRLGKNNNCAYKIRYLVRTLINFTYVNFLLKIFQQQSLWIFFFAQKVESSKNVEGDKEEISMIRYGIFFGEKTIAPYNHLGSDPKKIKWTHTLKVQFREAAHKD